MSLAGGVLSRPCGQAQTQGTLCGACEVTKLPAGLCSLSRSDDASKQILPGGPVWGPAPLTWAFPEPDVGTDLQGLGCGPGVSGGQIPPSQSEGAPCSHPRTREGGKNRAAVGRRGRSPPGLTTGHGGPAASGRLQPSWVPQTTDNKATSVDAAQRQAVCVITDHG